MIRVKQVVVTGDQYVCGAIQGSGSDPLIVRVALGPCCRSDRRYYFCILTDIRDNLFDLVRRHSELIFKHSFQFRENRLTDEQLVFSKDDLEYVLAKAAGGEGGYQNIGIQQYPHRYRRDRCA